MANGQSSYNRGASVLVVEDDSNDRELLSLQLRRGGLGDHVEFIGNGQEAWEFLKELALTNQAGQLIPMFLDLHLPGMSGTALLRRLRQDEKYRQLPVIVMSSALDPEVMEECRQLNVSHYISKPVTFASFSKAVADAFDSRMIGVASPHHV